MASKAHTPADTRPEAPRRPQPNGVGATHNGVVPDDVLEEVAKFGEPMRVAPDIRGADLKQASFATLPLEVQLHIRALELKCESAMRRAAEAELSLERARIAQVAQTAFRAKPVFFRDKFLHLVTKKELASVLGVAPDQISELSSRGALPPPIEFPRAFLDQHGQPIKRTDERGNKITRWDLIACLDTAMRYRRGS